MVRDLSPWMPSRKKISKLRLELEDNSMSEEKETLIPKRGLLPGVQVDELRRYVVYPVLQSMNLYSKAAERLILGTAAQESAMGSYLRQMRNGPARGVYQMEIATMNDLYDNYLRYRFDLFRLVDRWRIIDMAREIDIIGNLYYATALCRAHYYRFDEPLPHEDDLVGIARYYKMYWNSSVGKATPVQFMENYRKFIGIEEI